MKPKVLAQKQSLANLHTRAGLAAVRADTSSLRSAKDVAECEGDLAGLVADADTAVATGADLAVRQAEALESASQELLCSPEIIRCAQIAVDRPCTSVVYAFSRTTTWA